MQFNYTVYRETSDDSQVGHADHLRLPFFYDGHALQPVRVARPALADFFDKTGIDLKNDVEQARQ